MKKLTILLTWLACIVGLVSCSDDKNEEPQRLNLYTICTTYPVDKVETTYNGMDYDLPGEVVLAMEKPESYDPANPDARMILTMPDPWPDMNGIFPEVKVTIDATAYQDYMTYTGSAELFGKKMEVSGYCRNGVVSIDIDCGFQFDNSDLMLTDKTYEFELKPEELNLVSVYTEGKTVDWKGKTYNAKDFLLMAMTPVLQRMAENIGGPILTMKVGSDTSLSLGSRTESGGSIKLLAGTFLSNGALIACDAQGAETLDKAFFAHDSQSGALYSYLNTRTHSYTMLLCGKYPNYNQAAIGVVKGVAGPGFMSGGALLRWQELFASEGMTDEAEMLDKLASLGLDDKILLFGKLVE